MSKFKITKDLSNLSFVEIITLQKLLKHQVPVVRFILYHEINQFINPKINNKKVNGIFTDNLQQPNLSTSSFYNSLKSLEANGLISFIKRKRKGRDNIIAVKATERARLVIKGIIGHFFTSAIDEYDYMIKLFKELINVAGFSHLPNVLVLNLTESIDIRIMRTTLKLADEVFLLANKDIYDSMLKMGFDKLKNTVMFNNVIREPKDIFDLAIVPEYEKEPSFFGLSRFDILKELKRVVKQGGIVIFMVRATIPQVDNFYANVLLKKFEESISGRIFTEEEVKEDLEAVGFTRYEILDFKGVIIGIGWV